MFDYDSLGTCVLALSLAAVFVMVLLLRQRRTGRDAPIWLMSGLVGVLLGLAGGAAAMRVAGYTIARNPRLTLAVTPPPSSTTTSAGEHDDSAPAPGSGGGSAGQAGNPGAGMAGGGRSLPPKRQLTALVRKLELLTGDIALTLDAAQSAKLAEILARLRSQEAMSDEQATAAAEEILGLLDEQQRAKQDAIGLPFGRSGRGPGGGGGPGGSGGEQAADANPFREAPNDRALEDLLQRFGASASAASGAEAECTNPAAPAPAAD